MVTLGTVPFGTFLLAWCHWGRFLDKPSVSFGAERRLAPFFRLTSTKGDSPQLYHFFEFASDFYEEKMEIVVL